MIPDGSPSAPLGADAAAGAVTSVFAPLAVDYAAARPSYPRAVFDALGERLIERESRAAAGTTAPLVLDVAAGAGAASRGLVERGVRVAAIEPALEMLRQARRSLTGATGWLGGIAACGEALPIRASSVAAIVVAQAFHWLEEETALDEFARVLEPGGILLVVWNVAEADDFTREVWQLVERLNPGHKRPVTQRMRATPATLRDHTAFHVESSIELEHARALGIEDYVRYARSWSYVGGAMDPPTLAAFESALRRILARHHGTGPLIERFVSASHFARRV